MRVQHPPSQQQQQPHPSRQPKKDEEVTVKLIILKTMPLASL